MTLSEEVINLTEDTQIDQVLDSYKPLIADRYKMLVRRQYESLVKAFGLKMHKVYNSGLYGVWSSMVRPNVKQVNIVPPTRKNAEGAWETVPRDEQGGDNVIDEDKLSKNADFYAERTIGEWKTKIAAKLGDLDSGEVIHLDGYRFNIRGIKGTHKVRIDQDMIINVSSKGLLFNQYPARIYVDGKFTSEAKFKSGSY